jgi:eukaryotic-like serine/threonine-protein kinase
MRFAFGPGFELDAGVGALRFRGEEIPLQPRVFDTLRYLVENRDRIVPKEELIDALWNGETLNPVAVPWSVSHARKALEGRVPGQEFIKTVRGAGYRFTADARVEARTDAETAKAGPGSRASVAPGRSEPFVGRDGAMERLSAALGDARSGNGRLVLIEGEPGIGKSRCARELVDRVERSGTHVWAGRCLGGGAPAFWPWILVLRAIGDDRRAAPADRRAAEGLLSRLAPESLPVVDPRRPPVPALTDASRFWLSEALVRCLLRSAEAKVRVLLIEDLHDADEGSLEALALLAPELARARMLVVATTRPRAADPSQTDKRATRLRPTETIALAGLGLDDTTRYLEASLGRPVTTEVARAVHASTTGNPLFVKEAAQVLADSVGRDAMHADALRLPSVAWQLLRNRVATLDASTTSALGAAAVLGEEFELSVLKRVLPLAAATLLEALEAAARAKLIDRTAADGTYVFAHALVRDAFYEALPPVDRRRLHAAAAEALQALAVLRPRLGTIAHHLHAALPEANAEEAARCCRLAGDAAMDLAGYDEAFRFYGWALDANAYDDRAPDPKTACELLLSRALAARRSGRVRATREACGQAIEIARRENFAEDLLEAARILRPTVWIALVADPLALGALEHARPFLSVRGRARACGLLACLPPHSLDVRASGALGQEAVRLARELGDRSLLVEALVSTFRSLTGPDRIDDLLAAADEVLRAEGTDLTWWSAEAYYARHHALLQRGDAAGAERALATFGECARRLRMPEATWQHDRLRAQHRLYTGDFEGAESAFHELFARAGSFLTYGMFQYAAQMNALSWERDGRSLAAAGLGNQDVAWKWASELPEYRAELMLALLDLGDRATAAGELADLMKDDLAGVTHDLSYLYVLARLAEVAVRLEDEGAARTLYARLLPYGGYCTMNALSISRGVVAHHLGMLAALLGEPDAAAHFEESIAKNRSLGHTVHAKRSEEALRLLRHDAPAVATAGP